ncbi:hypothetical protein [Micromonospora sp. NBC_01796]|uniref:hypothetical protein n=1 Tax=Micromonospora sp. NBC_01796 TaxID=2975987 RepID=UPI002DD7B1E6|nr:hypothetical protein [Micromonospora sp. NBC_01796]WSA87921.1 hypothetical protein OIE47_10120 [Micromonospora sp. NBC_01796]
MVFDAARYEQEVIRPLRGRHGRLPVGDLLRRYAVEPGMDEVSLREHLRRIRMYWNQKAGGPDNRAQVCRLLLAADEELQRTHGADMYQPAWWQQQSQQWQQSSRATISTLAADLAKAYQPLGQVTRAQLAALVAHVPELSQAQIDDAVRQAKLRVVETVELPRSSGLDRTAYRQLKDQLGEVDAATVVQLVHPTLTQPFTLLRAFGVPGGPSLRLDLATLDAAIRVADSTADSTQVRARKAALHVLRTGLEAGAEPRVVALFQIVEQVAQGRAQGLADLLLIHQATALGLAREEAEILVASLATGAEAAGGSAVGRVRELLEEGLLRAAEQALAALPATDPDHAAVQSLVQAQHVAVERLVREAGAAVDAHREQDAERQLREALRIASDDEDLVARLRRLPPPPPRDVSVVPVDATVRLDWKTPDTAAEELRYCVVRTDGRAAAAPADGLQIAATKSTSAVDRQPPVARTVEYAVFASADGTVWSRAASGSAQVTPPLTEVTLRVQRDQVVGAWKRHPSLAAVRVRRTEGSPPDTAAAGVSIDTELDSFVDRAIGENLEYFYSLVAVYHDARRREVAAPMTVVSASPRAPASAVETLQVVPVSTNGDLTRVRLSWPTTSDAEVRVRYGGTRPVWEVGAVIAAPEMERYGRPVVGPRHVDGADTVLEAEVASGQQVYLPFAIGGTGVVVGRPVVVGVSEPVRQLAARRTGTQAVLSWVWPADVGMVEVAWTTPENGTQLRRITKSQYIHGEGCVLPVGPGGGTAEVSAIDVGSLGEARSMPIPVTVDGSALRLSYEVSRLPGLKGRLSQQRILRATVDADCRGVDLVVVASTGLAMPLRPDQGMVVNRFTGLTFARGVPLTFHIEIPARMRRPYWVRCFVDGPENVSVTDPPIDSLKVP